MSTDGVVTMVIDLDRLGLQDCLHRAVAILDEAELLVQKATKSITDRVSPVGASRRLTGTAPILTMNDQLITK